MSIAYQSLKVGCHTLSSRVILPAHTYNFSGESAVQQMCAYVKRRLQSGVSLAVTGEAEVPQTFGNSQMFSPTRQAGSASSELYRSLAKVANDTGKPIVEQIYHPGGQVWFEEGRAAFAPSVYPHSRSYVVPMALSQNQIRDIRNSFVNTARAIWENGLTGVELKADQGKLLHQFLSQEYNHRNDCFGGSRENRFRLLIQILEQIREKAPPDFMIGIRIPGRVTPANPTEHGVMKDDVSLDDCCSLANLISTNSLVDYISVSGETNSTVWGYEQNHGHESVSRATFAELSKEIRSHSNVPVFLAGRFLNMKDVDRSLLNGECDAVGMVRALIADPELVSKSQNDPLLAPSSVVPCTNCNISCVGRAWYGKSVACAFNPISGREHEISFRPNRQLDLKLLVVGAGPAGLEFSKTAGSLGANITLIEKEKFVGGQLNQWKSLPNCQNIELAIIHWKKCIDDMSNISLLTEVDFDEVFKKENFDRVVWAAGSLAVLPEFSKHATATNLSCREAISRKNWTDQSVLLVDADRYLDPLGLAWKICEAGGKVTVVTPFDMVGVDLDPVSRSVRMAALRQFGVDIRTWSDVRFSSDGEHTLIYDHCRNTSESVLVDVVVWCTNEHPVHPNSLIDDTTPCSVLGNASWPRGLDVTTKEAFDLAYSIANNFEEYPSER